MTQKNVTFDALLQLKDAGAITSSAAATVGGNAKIVNVGDGRMDGTAIIDVSAIDVSSGDERYNIIIQGSTSASFASVIYDLATLVLGDSSVTPGDTDNTTGRYELQFTNEQNGVIYPYIRAYTEIPGSPTTPSINYKAFIAPHGM